MVVREGSSEFPYLIIIVKLWPGYWMTQLKTMHEKVIEDNAGGVDDEKTLLHAKRWDIYVNKRGKLVKGGYLVEVFIHDKKKFIWEVVDDHVIEDPTDHEEIGLRGLI